jgi:hypothetical protein
MEDFIAIPPGTLVCFGYFYQDGCARFPRVTTGFSLFVWANQRSVAVQTWTAHAGRDVLRGSNHAYHSPGQDCRLRQSVIHLPSFHTLHGRIGTRVAVLFRGPAQGHGWTNHRDPDKEAPATSDQTVFRAVGGTFGYENCGWSIMRCNIVAQRPNRV